MSNTTPNKVIPTSATQPSQAVITRTTTPPAGVATTRHIKTARTSYGNQRPRRQQEVEEQEELERRLRRNSRRLIEELRRQGVDVRLDRRVSGLGVAVLPDAHRYIAENGQGYIGFSIR